MSGRFFRLSLVHRRISFAYIRIAKIITRGRVVPKMCVVSFCTAREGVTKVVPEMCVFCDMFEMLSTNGAPVNCSKVFGGPQSP